MRWLTAAWVSPRARAAAVKLPRSAASANVPRCGNGPSDMAAPPTDPDYASTANDWEAARIGPPRRQERQDRTRRIVLQNGSLLVFLGALGVLAVQSRKRNRRGHRRWPRRGWEPSGQITPRIGPRALLLRLRLRLLLGQDLGDVGHDLGDGLVVQFALL